METKTQAMLAEDFFRKTLQHFDRIPEEDSTEYTSPAEQTFELIGTRKGHDKSFYSLVEGLKTYYAFFTDGSWLIFDDTDKTQNGVCLKNEEIDSNLLPPGFSAKFNGKIWKMVKSL